MSLQKKKKKRKEKKEKAVPGGKHFCLSFALCCSWCVSICNFEYYSFFVAHMLVPAVVVLILAAVSDLALIRVSDEKDEFKSHFTNFCL